MNDDVRDNPMRSTGRQTDDPIAVVGMAGRFPGANNVGAFWSNLLSRRDSVCDFSNDELAAADIPRSLYADSQFVPSFGVLNDVDCFDAELFGYSAKEAMTMDPQQRVFLECVWSALEDAGRDPTRNPDTVGVFVGSSLNSYLLFNLFGNPAAYPGGLLPYGEALVPSFSTSDYVAARVAYQLGLTGPSLSIKCACASSLVAVVIACQSLVDYRCDVALAGGVSVSGRGPRGHFAQPGGMLSRSGRCRPFDDKADGSVFADAVGCVVLKRLEDAIRDRDRIDALLCGWATNNDGRDRVGFAAPSVQGQATVIAEALLTAGIEPTAVGFVEAHGSGTRVGDPIEFAALASVFGESGQQQKRCALGSVKGNIGHANAAAGIAGLIKATLAIRDGKIPASLHFREANSEIDFSGTPFFVPTTAVDFRAGADGFRYAGVSSFGLGGTNAHVVLRSYPARPHTASNEKAVVLGFSARTPHALKAQVEEMAQAFNRCEQLPIADVAWTLLTGRPAMQHRATVTGTSWSEIAPRIGALVTSTGGVSRALTKPRLVFMYPGSGTRPVGAAAILHRHYPCFREAFDRCAEAARRLHAVDVSKVISEPDAAPSGAKLHDLDLRAAIRGEGSVAAVGTPTLHAEVFALEFAMTELLRAHGVVPDCVIGYSLGEFLAAWAAGSMTMEDALRLVIARAHIIEKVAEGAMVAVPVSAREAVTHCADGVRLAAINADDMVVLSGVTSGIAETQMRLREAGHLGWRLPVTRAYHSAMLEPCRPEIEAICRDIPVCNPAIPFVSCIDGQMVTQPRLPDGRYWAEHACRPVLWRDAIIAAVGDAPCLLVEIGFGRALCGYSEAAVPVRPDRGICAIPTIASEFDEEGPDRTLAECLAILWRRGVDVRWQASFEGHDLVKQSLPTYSFERTRYWIPPAASGERTAAIPTLIAATDVTPRSTDGVAQLPVPSPIPERPQTERAYRAPANQLEESLCALWASVLGHHPIGVDDDLFEIGGHSLIALQLSNLIWRKHRVELPVRTILEKRAIRAIAGDRAFHTSTSNATEGIAQRLRAVNDANVRQRIAENWVASMLSALAGSGEEAISTVPKTFDQEFIATRTADLIGAFRRAFGVPIYPNELVAPQSVESLARLAVSLVENSNEVSAPRFIGDRAARHRIDNIAFLLSAPRSGSTLLRVMLAGHTQLFCPPELHLLAYPDMATRAQAEISPDRDQGLVRAFAELMVDGRVQAQRLVDHFNQNNAQISDVLARLAHMAAPKILIDKSPGNTAQLETLERAERLFNRPKYVCLLRHPYAVIESVAKNRFDRLLGVTGLSPRVFGEYLWLRSNGNMIDFAKNVPRDRVWFLKYEDLVADPEGCMKELSAFLEVEFEPELLKPYEGRRMRDGLGDPNFLTHSTIQAELGEIWRSQPPPSRLSPACRELAVTLGYDLMLRDLPRTTGPSLGPLLPGIRTAHAHDNIEYHIHPLSSVTDTNDRSALILFHALDGTVDLYRAIAPLISQGGTPYGIECSACGGRTVEDIARSYALGVASRFPSTQLHLAGWSFGGLIAYETARQLEAQGVRVHRISVIDTPAPHGRCEQQLDDKAHLKSFMRSVAGQTDQGFNLALDELAPLDPSTMLRTALCLARDEGVLPGELLVGDMQRRFSVYCHLVRALQCHTSGNTDIPVALVVARRGVEDCLAHPISQHADENNGWRAIACGPFAVEKVNATHYELLNQPHVLELARALERAWLKLSPH